MNLPETKQQQIATNQIRLCKILSWSDQVHNFFVLNSGVEYLEFYLNDHQQAKLVANNEVFWNWWRNLFDARDQAFIDQFEGCTEYYSNAQLEKIYFLIHSPKMLSDELKLPRIVYETSSPTLKITQQ